MNVPERSSTCSTRQDPDALRDLHDSDAFTGGVEGRTEHLDWMLSAG
jgi:hypothetical protein